MLPLPLKRHQGNTLAKQNFFLYRKLKYTASSVRKYLKRAKYSNNYTHPQPKVPHGSPSPAGPRHPKHSIVLARTPEARLDLGKQIGPPHLQDTAGENCSVWRGSLCPSLFFHLLIAWTSGD
jgi:hypothetical protein